jgi:catechol 2,3-dioxygenase-like lactoylglutathione lyase family enzyme
MPAIGMNHFTILTNDLDKTLEFYNDLLGLVPGDRPPLPFPGAWLYAGEQAVLHVIAGRQLPANAAGVIDHMAFSAENLIETVNKLEARGLEYALRQVTPKDPWQLFFHDPSGAKVELDYPSDEPLPATIQS